jgi:hypothetical protein
MSFKIKTFKDLLSQLKSVFSILLSKHYIPDLVNLWCMPNREATNTKFIVFSLTHLGLEPTIYHIRGKDANHYFTDVGISYWIINVSEWSDVLTRRLLFQWASTIKYPTKHDILVQSGHNHHLISLNW